MGGGVSFIFAADTYFVWAIAYQQLIWDLTVSMLNNATYQNSFDNYHQ